MRMSVSGSGNRRGMLLLLVLSMLTLFLLMGATGLVMATRAREAARAFASATAGSASRSSTARGLLDEALFILIRGSKDPTAGAAVSESLLGDMYGDAAEPGKVPFKDEAFDAFGTDRFLTDLETQEGKVLSVRAAAFGSGSADVDNDADGVADGVWLEGVLPAMASAEGGELTFRVSYLVLDLDGRINVNAHGSPSEDGGPVGPADIDASGLCSQATWEALMKSGTLAPRSTAASKEQWRPAPRASGVVESRFGADPVDPPQGMSRTYAIRLDQDAPRPALIRGATAHNPFTPGELERILRPFDPDAATLPPRLAALLDDRAERMRFHATTDSWDVTSKVGPAAPADGGDPELRFDLASLPNDKQQFATALFDAIKPETIAGDSAATAQWVANVAEFRAAVSGAAAAAQPLTIGGHTVTGVTPSDLREAAALWGGSGGFVSSGELIGIPQGSKAEIDQILDEVPPIRPLVSRVVSHPAILEAVMIPSRFTATIAQDSSREPGRVNVNTCSDDVWRAVAGGAGGEDVPRPARPCRRLWDVLSNAGFRPPVPPDLLMNPHDVRRFNRDLANRLASVTTVRSNVFAVWITVEIEDSAPTAAPPSLHRLFAIVDRSMPVEYAKGENRNVRETIRLRRFLN